MPSDSNQNSVIPSIGTDAIPQENLIENGKGFVPKSLLVSLILMLTAVITAWKQLAKVITDENTTVTEVMIANKVKGTATARGAKLVNAAIILKLAVKNFRVTFFNTIRLHKMSSANYSTLINIVYNIAKVEGDNGVAMNALTHFEYNVVRNNEAKDVTIANFYGIMSEVPPFHSSDALDDSASLVAFIASGTAKGSNDAS